MERRTVGGREVLLEFHRMGQYIKVSAIDPVTNVETSIVGSPRVSEQELTRLAVRKLDFVLRKRRGSEEDGSSGGGIEA